MTDGTPGMMAGRESCAMGLLALMEQGHAVLPRSRLHAVRGLPRMALT